MQPQELITILENSFGKKAKDMNFAIRKAYSYSKNMFNDTDIVKQVKILPLLNSNHIYVKYWGAVIALSYGLLEERAIKELLYILDLNPKEFAKEFDILLALELNILKMDIGSTLYDYKKNGIIGSFPGHNDHIKISDMPHYGLVVRYYKRKYKNR